MKYKITTPTEFTGLGAGDLPFLQGVAHTDDEWIAAWHESNGYKVEKVKAKAAATTETTK
ncbi:hypothetical protein CN514_00920 [Bacillus sp. AFS001701]|uniref:hypothetical protein n=1 Tax=Bacillus sp. AFS001701 TaxID=2033480 RepID=UPI000BFA2D67|nr:hypothetical protein [Bacillus sp. AFS001701]PET77589.1 hypothetical protein CN514_00920 [Bacillus sp. AFS001701]